MDIQGETKAERQARERREATHRDIGIQDQTVQVPPSRQEAAFTDWGKIGKQINWTYFRHSLGLLVARTLLAASMAYGCYVLVTEIFPQIDEAVIARYGIGGKYKVPQ